MLLAPAEGEAVTDEPARTVLILNAHALLDVTWSRYESGERGPDRHVHARHADSFFVLDGELLFELGGRGERPAVARAGAFVAVPPGIVHTFGNESGATATFLYFHAPGCGFADSLRGRDVDFDTTDPPEDGGRDPAGAIVCAPGEGERHRGNTSTVTILGELSELSAHLIEFGPGFAVDPHAHGDHLDSFFLLDGETELTLGERAVRASPGTWMAAPPDTVHGFRHAGMERSSILNVHAPDAGFAVSIRRRFA